MEPSVNTTLKLMKETLICAICKEFYKTPVLLVVCSHNFCSICIRRYFTIKQECPICGLDASSGSLVPNRILETLTKHFDNLRGALEKEDKTVFNNFVRLKEVDDSSTALSNLSIVLNGNLKPCVLVGRLEVPNTVSPLCETSLPEDSSAVDNTPEFSLGLKDFCTQSQGFSMTCQSSTNSLSSESHDMFIDHQPSMSATDAAVNGSISSPNAKAVPSLNIPSETSSNSHANVESIPKNDPSNASCPVCGIPVATSSINSHLDNCLAREEKKKALRQNTPKRMMRNKPPISKLAYNLLSLRDLRSKLKQIGLPNKGDKAELKRRHQEFLAKYQAEQDKIDPRSTDVLIAELNREEMRRKQLKVHLSPQRNSLASSSGECIGRQEHMDKYAKQYKQLEDIARKSLPPKGGSKRKLEDSDDKGSVAGCSADLSDNAKVPCLQIAQKKSEIVLLSKDSEDFCPDSQPTSSSSFGSLNIAPLHSSEEVSRPVSPELYATSVKEEPSTLQTAIEADSQSEDIKLFIDASLT